MLLSVWAMLKMWSCRRLRRIALSASLEVSGVPSSCWKNQSGVCWYQTRVWPQTRVPVACAKSMSVLASGLIRKFLLASYQPSGFIEFSGVT